MLRSKRARRAPPSGAAYSRREADPRRASSGLAAALAILAFAACSERDPRTLEQYVAEVEWFSAMRRQPSVEPYEAAPRMPAPGTLPVDGEPPLPLTEAERIAAGPQPPTPESLARGKEQYDIFCAVCHGPEGKGGGNVATPTGFPAGLIANLTTARAVGLTDGYLYGMILNGRGLMPSYRRIPAEDRWHIVNYVRQLQRQAARGAVARSVQARRGPPSGAAYSRREADPPPREPQNAAGVELGNGEAERPPQRAAPQVPAPTQGE